MNKYWDNIAEARKKQIESGLDITFSQLFVPYYKKLFQNFSSDSVLEVGCGTGHMAYEIHNHIKPKKHIIIDESEKMIEVAIETVRDTDIILKNENFLDYFDNIKFDLIYSHLCLHAVCNLKMFLYKIHKFLKDDGVFVFSIPHPCFYNLQKKIIDDINFNYKKESKEWIKLKITNDAEISDLIPYIHRPLDLYFSVIFESNLNLIGFFEICPEEEIRGLYLTPPKYPNYLVFVLRNTSAN